MEYIKWKQLFVNICTVLALIKPPENKSEIVTLANVKNSFLNGKFPAKSDE